MQEDLHLIFLMDLMSAATCYLLANSSFFYYFLQALLFAILIKSIKNLVLLH